MRAFEHVSHQILVRSVPLVLRRCLVHQHVAFDQLVGIHAIFLKPVDHVG